MGILAWIFLGLVAGALARFIVPGRQPGGCLTTIVIGIVGAVLGGFISQALGLGHIESFDLGGIFIATAGAVLLLVLFGLIRK